MKLNTKILTGMAMLSALSIISLLVGIAFPLPFTPSYMLYDVADVFVFLGTFMYGPLPGFIIISVVSAIQAFLLPAGSGIAGFVMHLLSTGAFTIVAGLIYKRKHTFGGALTALGVGSLVWIIVILPANLLVHPLFNGMAVEGVVALMPAILVFNVIKCIGNSAITILIYKRLHIFFRYIGFADNDDKKKDCYKFYSKSEKQTLKLAKKFAKKLTYGDTVLLDGDLGAGKTVFVKGIAKHFGIKEEILSPTFNILKEYKSGKFCHFDMYRIEDETELENLGFEEYFTGDRLCLVEWNKMGNVGKSVYRVKIERTDDNKRNISILHEVKK